MKDPIEFYQAEKGIFEKEFSSLKKKLAASSTLRLLVFLGTSLGVYFSFNNTNFAIGIAVVGIAAFLYLVVKHTDLQHKRDLTKALININDTEIKVLNRDYYDLEDGKEFIDPNHYFSYDIDLFGRGSFFQYLNRTATNEGKNKLAGILADNNISQIEFKQTGIKGH
jgi:hypothetical protein